MATKKSIRSDLDRLIDWHELNAKDKFGPKEYKVPLATSTIKKWARVKLNDDGRKILSYRSREIIPLDPRAVESEAITAFHAAQYSI